MREYKCTHQSGETVDLDNSETYKHLPTDLKELDNIMFKEIGQATVYMNHFHKDWYCVEKDIGFQQRIRVNKLIRNFANERKNNYENVMWFQEQVFLFQDETENMC